ncbi:MAG TPA: HD domain-containing phosphohydrolase [Thermoleophilaceae bacterium]|nr:HD domain-containing phosphohydrolase [Thermoleophilaceae bacterium]
MGKLNDQLGDEVVRLRSELAKQERAMRAREEEFGRYITQLRKALRMQKQHADEVSRSYVAAVRALTNAVEARDAYTGKHAERVAAYGLELTTLMDPTLAADPETEFGFLLHDVGKVAVPDAILHKPSALDRREMGVMRRHPVTGYEIVSHIDFLEGNAKRIVRYHHERWDGQGYPDGIRQRDIPLAARIFAVADTLDAITSDRPYRAGVSIAEAREEIARGAGSQFDPDAVDALMAVPDDVLDRIRTETALASLAAP